MPSIYFSVVWPDETRSQCYSPSTVIKKYIVEGESYEVELFLEKVREGLGEASDRVSAKFGFSCSAAADELRTIEERIEKANYPKGSKVLVKRITENDL
ncbi:MSMEG_0570 family nitrogen starvation response protein [Methylotenera sp.]|uniref:MSMEG_0570 family nitrogen starvation response protein n=1 Tax=Methylotenera sp. TaxID=2051956 RepID=UPI0027370C8A|nr:MSMEG_0570 family nitrogen starvation response protein [Methylotenera sp.]MDP3777654.1 MSMEG_0570 family nitrogen starvation response protein [Methylotenera sp.]